MGVPKFYRWISERYPCLSEVVKEYQLPEFDNLYLDMNGIIHTCSHPDDNNPHFRITEEKIFSDVFHYIEVLFRMIKPKKVFFMAVDGVAPRAKMNQQRGRRFRSAREAEELIKQAIMKGESLPKEERFDSNCITPGTEFMARLHEALQYFVVKKVSTDRLWQGPRIYLSGHETPGEGEHKIMDFIRSEKAKDGYDPNTRHCLYGLDADLIMLGLTTHEPHFALLREEVKFTGRISQKRSSAPEETTFHLLHLSLMREYLDYEFAELKTTLPFEYSLERVIDDWVLMGFLVGNDFIPHLPHIHIHQECLPALWSTYKQVLPKLDGYLNDGGFLNLARFEKYLTALSQFDIDNFQERYADMKWAEGKRKQLKQNLAEEADHLSEPVSHETNNSLSSAKVGIPTATEFMEQKGLNDCSTMDGSEKLLCLDDAVEEIEDSSSEYSNEEDAVFASEFKKYKANYYVDKMEFKDVTPAVLQSQSHGYIKAIQWILHYYYNGVQSWSWFYPHHYAPYLSDVKNFSELKLQFDLGKPFLPFQQLMAVLPTASKNLLPTAFQSLMVQETSPVVDFYPVNFETDLNGKQQEWEAVVLIPFIEEERLLAAMKPLEEKLQPSEKQRNRHGPHLLYVYTPQSVGIYQSPQPKIFPDISNSHALVTELAMNAFVLLISELKKGLCVGVQDIFYPGFPTLKHLPHTASLSKACVKVFQMNSRGDNMILHITELPPMELETAAEQLVGQSVLVGWPHLFEAFVVAVSNDETRISLVGSGSHAELTSGEKKNFLKQESLTVDEATVWHREMDGLTERYMNRWGTDVGATHLLIYAKPIAGRRYVCSFHGKVTLDRQWQSKPEPFLGQTVVKDVAVYNQSFCQFKTLEDLFLPKAKVFLLGNPHYGCAGEVLDVEKKDDARIRVSFTIPTEPDLTEFRQNKGGNTVRYFPAYSVAQRLGITPHLFSRITGTIFLTQNGLEDEKPSQINIGLNLKFNKTNKEVPGYTRKVENDWLYSNKVADILADYIRRFPEVFDCIRLSNQNNSYHMDEVFKSDRAERLTSLTSYLKSLACASITPISQGTMQVEEETVKQIEGLVNRSQEQNKRKKKLIKMQVRPHLLYQPLEAQATLIPDPSATYELFDRVINVRDGYSVPLGLRGTIIGIIPGIKERESVYEVLFDEEFVDALTIRSSPNRCYQLPSYAMINITHGERKDMHLGHQPMNALGASFGPGPWKTNAQQASLVQAEYSSPEKRSFVLQQERPSTSRRLQPKSDFPVPKILSRPQDKGSESFENIWNQLKGQQKQNSFMKVPSENAEAGGETSSAPAASSFQPLLPPQSWIQRNLDQKNKQTDGKKLKSEEPQTVKTRSDETALQGITNGLKIRDSLKVSNEPLSLPDSAEDEKFDSAAQCLASGSGTVHAMSDRQMDRSNSQPCHSSNSSEPPAVSYGQSVRLDDLFKGLRECCSLHDQPQLMQPVPSNAQPNLNTGQSEAWDPVASLAASFMSGMPLGIRPTTLAPYENEQTSAQTFPISNSLGPQQLPPRTALHSEQPTLGQPAVQQPKPTMMYQNQSQQQHTMGSQARPIQPLMSVPLVQPLQSLHAPVHNQPVLQQFQTALPPQLNMAGNSVKMLSMYCLSKGLPEPQYQCQTGNDGRFRFVVYLQGGVKFVGSWANQVDKAAESAAGITMYHLNASAKKAGFSSGPEFMASPNSAFTRVQAFQGNPNSNYSSQPLPGFLPHQQNVLGFPVRTHPPANWGPGFMNQPGGFMPSQFPPKAYLQRDPRGSSDASHSNNNCLSNFPGSSDRFLNPAPKEQRSVKSKTDWVEQQTSNRNETGSSGAPIANQFIPTQVLRQNKTPQKASKASNDEENLASAAAAFAEEPRRPVPNMNSASEAHHSSIEKENASISGNLESTASSPRAVLPPRSSKRTRSRIAANFSLNKE